MTKDDHSVSSASSGSSHGSTDTVIKKGARKIQDESPTKTKILQSRRLERKAKKQQQLADKKGGSKGRSVPHEKVHEMKHDFKGKPDKHGGEHAANKAARQSPK